MPTDRREQIAGEQRKQMRKAAEENGKRVEQYAKSERTMQQSGEPAQDDEPLTDVGNAERFVWHHGPNVRYVREWGWMVWTGKHWERDELKARELMLETARAIHVEAANTADTEKQKAIAAWARKTQAAQRLQAALWCAQPMLATRTDEFDREPMLLPVLNGTVDLRTGKLHPHRREHMVTRLAPVFFSADARCPAWDKFLKRVLPDDKVREFVQRFAGYSLTGLATEQVLAFLYGAGRNGKSVFLETLAAAMGDYHAPTRSESLSIARGGGIPNDIAALAGARLVTVSETPEGARLNESLVKDLTGGDTITARFLRHEFFQFRPQFKLWIRGNHKPQIRGTDDGIWRRILLVPFTVQIPEREVDTDLPEILRGELSGIIKWAVDGCLAWQREGLRPPASVREAVNAYREESDILGTFLAECCELAPEYSDTAKNLFTAYKEWCDETGERPVTQKRFGISLAERGFHKTTPKTVVWHGLRIRASDHCDHSRSSCQSRTHDSGKPEERSQPSEPSDRQAAAGGSGPAGERPDSAKREVVI